MENKKNNINHIYIDTGFAHYDRLIDLDNESLVKLYKIIRKLLYKRGVFKCSK